ncbi:SAM-dependent methyltransferase [Planomicrobium stackebrandtii]|uniref:SAM-dependent methyltransferase n=1 Tax=Planomicrobium stackebrandtii TaxID=253160 RepID=A0ABU0GVZ8_9BACL|nr:class I SAM-dependent methyltransferase [Planomicrobium stackebrandtii]MDQ0429530.1 SAM-dependent methyltransferase [Planomicrobium stackebrandtii]
MKLYKELAEWWPLMSPHTEYEEEAELFLKIIKRYHPAVKDALEFGSGGGSNAFYLKKYFSMTLTDLSPDMLAVSRELNPDCPHLQGDMRTIEVEGTYDLVFIHDAITYFTEKADLLAVMKNAKKHLKPDGLLFIMPDEYTETFEPRTGHGGIDKDGRGMRYLEWSYDSDPDDHMLVTEYAYVMRDRDGQVTHEHDSMKAGLFSMPEWDALLAEAGFKAHFERVEFSEEPGTYFGIAATQLE